MDMDETISNWKSFIEKNYSDAKGRLKIIYSSMDSNFPNIQLISSRKSLNIGFHLSGDSNILYSLDIESEHFNLDKQYHALCYSKENEAVLRKCIDPLLIDGWVKCEFKYLGLLMFKTEFKDAQGAMSIAPTKYNNPLWYWQDVFSFGMLKIFCSEKRSRIEPILK